MENEELNKKLAEWVGFKRLAEEAYPSIYKTCPIVLWELPYGVYHEDLPNFTQSLDACFKWLVPKLCRWEIRNYIPHIVTYDKPRAEIATTYGGNPAIHGGWLYGEAEAETPALALCLAIRKLIDKEVTNEESKETVG